jgi:TPR repeat protein
MKISTLLVAIGLAGLAGLTPAVAGPDAIANADAALRDLPKACGGGRTKDCATLAGFFLFDNHLSSQPQRAVETFESLCGKVRKHERCEWPVEAQACRRAGEMHALGQAVTRNEERGRTLLKKASEAGDAMATVQLAELSERKSPDEAARLYTQACGQSDFFPDDCGWPAAYVETYRGTVLHACEMATRAGGSETPAPAKGQ